jgi:hypothetical protein
MAELMRWQMRDPCLVLESKQAAAINRARRALFENPFGELWRKGERIMDRDESAQIEELLMVWYGWAKRYRPQLGAPRITPYGRHTEPDAGNVHDDGDEVDARIATDKAEAVDACLNELTTLQRVAIGLHVANKDAGAAVYRSERLPGEKQHQVYQEAKAELLPMLRRKGFMHRTTQAAAPAFTSGAAR